VQQLADSFSLATDAQRLAETLIRTVDRFAHLAQARYVCLLSQPAVTLQGTERAAIVCLPNVQGPLKRMFDWMVASLCAPVLNWDEPDFLILIDAAYWSSRDTTGMRKERLVYHELCHVVARTNEYGVPKLDHEGRPMLKLVPHDAEFFHDEVERYGLEVCQLEETAASIAAGFRKDERDKRGAA
jgi:hypothetical protein